jgi:UvrD-like helicase family protein
MVDPTEEQQAAVARFLTGRPLKITAFAGAGKTTTLRILAEATQARGIYLAFNRAVADEARVTFPRSAHCQTTHAIAFKAMIGHYRLTAKMVNALHARQLAALSFQTDRVFSKAFRLDGVQQAYLVLGTVKQFCQSNDPIIGLDHVPIYARLLGVRPDIVANIRDWAVVEAHALWRRMTNKRDEMPLGHNGYLKAWALAGPTLNTDYILLDEAQDTNPVVLGVLAGQRAQVVYVGDPYQQIYEWRGAVNAMDKMPGCEETALTQSFRFGEAIAAEASRLLATLGEHRQVRGNPEITSAIATSGTAEAVLARTNATVILEILEATGVGLKPHVCGGTEAIKRLLSDVYELKAGRPAVSPEFFGFQNWWEVVAFANTEEGQDLRTFVQLVQQQGEGKLWAAVNSAVANENHADVILSTAHKAKGREWNSVRLADDFISGRLGPDPEAEAEVRLFYVAMTRAKNLLIASPELLHTFTTNVWKMRQSSRHASPADSGNRPADDQRRSRQQLQYHAAGAGQGSWPEPAQRMQG